MNEKREDIYIIGVLSIWGDCHSELKKMNRFQDSLNQIRVYSMALVRETHIWSLSQRKEKWTSHMTVRMTSDNQRDSELKRIGAWRIRRDTSVDNRLWLYHS